MMITFSVLLDPLYFPYSFHFSKLLLLFLGFAVIQGSSGCLCFLGMAAVLRTGQPHFWRMFLVPKPSSQAHSSQAGREFLLSVFFSRYVLLFTKVSLLTRTPLWLLRSHGNRAGSILWPMGEQSFCAYSTAFLSLLMLCYCSFFFLHT